MYVESWKVEIKIVINVFNTNTNRIVYKTNQYLQSIFYKHMLIALLKESNALIKKDKYEKTTKNETANMQCSEKFH